MKQRTAIMFAGALLALGLWSMTAYSQRNNPKMQAQQDVLKLVDSMRGNKGDVKARTAAFKKKFADLEPIMWIYQPRKKDGLGMGKDGAGIELELGRLGGRKSRLTPAKIAALKPDLIKAAEISKAIAEVADLYSKDYKDNNTGKLNPAKWKEYTKQMRKGADEMIQATKGGNPMQMKKAINNLNASCTNCHGDFR